jgi:hypothetical protein
MSYYKCQIGISVPCWFQGQTQRALYYLTDQAAMMPQLDVGRGRSVLAAMQLSSPQARLEW